MADLSSLRVLVTADTRDFSRKMTGAQRAMGDLTQTAKRLAGMFGFAFGAYTIGREIRSTIRAIAEQEKAVEGLRATLELTGRDGGGALDRLTEKAAALQRVTTAADEELIGATASLGQLAKELDTGELERAQEAIIGIADVFLKGDVNNAAILLGKTLGSTTNALTRYGIQVDSTASQSEKLRQVMAQSQIFFDASKAKALTLSGRLEQLRNAYGDLKEQVGDVLVQLAGFGPRVDGAKSSIVSLTAAIENNKDEILAWARAIGRVLKAAAIAGLTVGVAKLSAALYALYRTLKAAALASGLASLYTAINTTGAAAASAAVFIRAQYVASLKALAAPITNVVTWLYSLARALTATGAAAASARVFLLGMIPGGVLVAGIGSVVAGLGVLGAKLIDVAKESRAARAALRELQDAPSDFSAVLPPDMSKGAFQNARKELEDQLRDLADRRDSLEAIISEPLPSFSGLGLDATAIRQAQDAVREERADAERELALVDARIQGTIDRLGALGRAWDGVFTEGDQRDGGSLLRPLSELTTRTREFHQTLEALPPKIDLFEDTSSITATATALERQREAVRTYTADLIDYQTEIPARIAEAQRELAALDPTKDADKIATIRQEIANWQVDLARLPGALATAASQLGVLDGALSGVQDAMARMAAAQDAQSRTLENWRTGIASVLPSADEFQQRMAAMATAAASLGIALGNMDFTAFAAGLQSFGSVLDAATDSIQARLDAFAKSLPQQFYGVGVDLVRGIGRGMEDTAEMLRDIMLSIISSLISVATGGLKIFSPSRVSMGWGENLVKGLVLGIEGQRGALEQSWQSVLGTFGPPELQPASAVAGASAISPQIVVDMTGVTLFGDPASEARKIGSQVFLREGYTIARESGFNG